MPQVPYGLTAKRSLTFADGRQAHSHFIDSEMDIFRHLNIFETGVHVTTDGKLEPNGSVISVLL